MHCMLRAHSSSHKLNVGQPKPLIAGGAKTQLIEFVGEILSAENFVIHSHGLRVSLCIPEQVGTQGQRM